MALVDCGGGVRLERGVECRLSDGTVLVSDHYYPAGNGPWPTLLMRQPYGRDIASTVVYAHPAWFARHGYHVAIQDVRGRGGSEGTFYPFRNEGSDGAQAVAGGAAGGGAIDASQSCCLQWAHRHVWVFLPGRDATAGSRGAA